MGERSDLSRPNRARQITASEPLQDSPDSARAQCRKGPNHATASTGCANRRICAIARAVVADVVVAVRGVIAWVGVGYRPADQRS